MANENNEAIAAVQVTETVVAYDFYSCEEAVQRLNDYLDHELNDDERADVAKHLAICKSCLERFSFEETLIVSLKLKVQKICCPGYLKSRLGSLIRR